MASSSKLGIPPFLVFKECSIQEPDLISAEIFISAEQKIIMKLPTGCMIEAIKCFLFTHYI